VVTVVLLAAAAWAPAVRACSQCLCGTPFPADVLGGVVPLQLRYGFEELYLSKANALDDGPGSEREREHRVAAFALWRPLDRLALIARLPYNIKRITERPSGEVPLTQRAQGVGDAGLQALVGVHQTRGTHPLTVGLLLGAEIPTGSNERRGSDGERLDAHLQPGTGAWSGSGGVHVGVSMGRAMLDASLIGRANGANVHGYRYGDVLLFNAGYASAPRRGWSLIAQLNGRAAGRDRLEDGARGDNTGGTVVYAAPGVRWQGALGIGIEGTLQIPVIESLLGDQDEHTTARVALSVSR
jgi:hypothetical protein